MLGRKLLLIMLSAFLMIQCAGGGTVRFPKSEFKKSIGDYRKMHIRAKSRNLLGKYGFEIEREEGTEDDDQGDIYIESKWKERVPFESEKADNIISARTKIIIRARSTNRSLNMTSGERIYKAEFSSEDMVLIRGQEDWTKQTMSPELMEYLEKLYDELAAELRFTR